MVVRAGLWVPGDLLCKSVYFGDCSKIIIIKSLKNSNKEREKPIGQR